MPISIDTTMANTSTEKLSLWTPFPTSPILKDPKAHLEHHDDQWQNIKAIIAAITVPQRSLSSPTSTTSENTTLVDSDSDEETSALLLPKIVDSAPLSPSATSVAYGTFHTPSPPSTATVVPLHPSTTPLLTSAALTPVYILLLLLPLLPFWIFAGFLSYTALVTASPSPALLIALGVLVPFNVVGTVAVVWFALGETARFAEQDLEAGLGARRASGSSVGSLRSEKKHQQRLWRPSMRFVLQGSRRG